MTEQQFTSQELAKLKAADPDGVISVRVEQIAEFIEQKGRLIEQKERLIEQNVQLIQQNKQLLAKDVRSEEEKAEYRSKIAALEQRISDLERSKKLNSGNNSKPPSSDGLSKETVEKKPKRTNSLREKSDRKPCGQPGHAGTTLEQVDNPDQIVDHIPNQCPGCSATLSKSDAVKFSSRQVFNIPDPSPLIVTEHRGYTCQCKGCGAEVPANFPDGVNARVQYGNNLASVAAYMYVTQCLPVHRTAMFFFDCYGIKLSSGTVANLIARKADEFRGPSDSVYDTLLSGKIPVKHLDETGLRVAGKLGWVHILCSPLLSHLRLGTSRGDIPRDMDGTVIHDCLSKYFTLENVRHGVCNQHLIRELKAAHEIDGELWAAEMKVILYEGRDLSEAARNAGQDAVDPVATAKIERRYEACYQKAIKYHEGLPPLPRLSKSNRGPKKKRKGHNLALRFQKYKDMVLLFLHDLSVPFTNNEAEQGLRKPKVREKVSGCFRTEKGLENYCILRTVTETGRKHGQGALETLRAGPAAFMKLLELA